MEVQLIVIILYNIRKNTSIKNNKQLRFMIDDNGVGLLVQNLFISKTTIVVLNSICRKEHCLTNRTVYKSPH